MKRDGTPLRPPQEPSPRIPLAFGTLAHELRNPLGRVSNAAHMLRAVGTGDPRLGALADIIDRQVIYIESMVNDMLEGTRVALGKARLAYAHASLRGIVDDAIETCALAIAARAQPVEVLVPDSLVVEVDRLRIQQVMVNLLSNASKFSPAGAPIRVRAQVQADQVEISVRDEGQGIEGELLPHVFDLFAQNGKHGGCAGDGLGLGLGVVRSIVELHGGAVEARSDGPGRGAEFVVRLPLRASRAP